MDSVKAVSGYAAGGTFGTLCIAYGLQEFLYGSHGGYGGFGRYLAQGEGVVLTFVGWVVFVVVAISFYRDLRAMGG